MSAPTEPSGGSDDFDGLTFFIYVMALLTAIVAGFAGWNWRKVAAKEKEISRELKYLKLMESEAGDPDFQIWVGKERLGQSGGGRTAADFQALINNQVQESGLSQSLSQLTQRSQKELRSGAIELTYRVVFKSVRVENLVRMLATIEQEWPGARVAEIVELRYRERQQGWDATVDLSIINQPAT